jgi:hypothetical protein
MSQLFGSAGLLARQGNCELGASAGTVCGMNLAAMRLDNATADRQSQADSALAVVHRRSTAEIPFKYL